MADITVVYQKFSLGRSSVNTQLDPSRTGPFTFGMVNINTSIFSPAPSSSVNPGVGLGGTISPYLAHRFGSGHIPPSTPFVGVFSFPSSGIKTSVHSHGGGSEYVHIGSMVYIPSYVPSSIVSIHSNAFLMINTPFILLFGFFTFTTIFGLILVCRDSFWVDFRWDFDSFMHVIGITLD